MCKMGAILLIEDNANVQELIAKILPRDNLKILRKDSAGQEKTLEGSVEQNSQRAGPLTIEEAVRDALKGESGLAMVGGVHDRIIGRVEKALIGTVLEEEKGNQVRAAKRLGINRNTLRKKMKELKITPRFISFE
jgi:two-component system nitrogen regulation response regulator GlnG